MENKIIDILLRMETLDIYIWTEDDSIKYNAPEGVMTDELLFLLKDNKKEIIKYINKENSPKSIIFEDIKPIANQQSYFLSNAQKRLWLLNQFDKDSIAYNMPSAFTLRGELNTVAFNQAFTFMIERHESLRTVFMTENGEPRQKILNDPNFSVEIIDLRASSDPAEDSQILAEKDIMTPFNLETGALVRLSVIQIENEKNLLLFNMHHIISDGWSMNIFIGEFLVCYNNFREGNAPDLKPLRIHYKDYSAWQNNLLVSPTIEAQRTYWFEKLSGELPVLDLPFDKVRPVSKTFNGNSLGFYLSRDITSALNNLCINNKISLFMMLQALVKVLFYRYTGQSDIILGSPVAGRVHDDLKDQIGFYINTLIFRDSIIGDLSFYEILTNVKRTCTDAFDNQDYPFDRLVEDLEINRDFSRSPLFDVLLVLHNNETSTVELKGLELSPYKLENVVSKFDMTFNFSENKEGLFCVIEYNTDIYTEDRIERMGEHFKTLISSVISNPQSQIKDLQIIPMEEKNLLFNVFNDTKTEYPADKTIIDLFEEQVRKTPDNFAVVFEEVNLTYWELNKKANVVGHYLRDNFNIKPADFVGVMLERSEKMIIALLGILKTGAAYVPIDPEYPKDRIDYIIQDSNLKIVLSNENNDLLVNIDQILEKNLNIENLVTILNPDNLAYIIYTSGSTGKPKGVLIQHSNLYNYLSWIVDNWGDSIGNSCLLTSYAFDLSITGMFSPLITGNSLFIYASSTDISKLLKRCFLEDRINFVKLTPSHISILDNIEISSTNISLIFSGGEELSKENISTLKRLNPNIEIVNHYGPTESTVGCIAGLVIEASDFISIGKPISNTYIYVIDKDNSLTPLGITGELCISGAGLARGYLNWKELSEERFTENPYLPGERMYRTGDLARWLPDGNLEFLGRIDDQVKIRGFRIELGEIENSLIRSDDIITAVVLVKEVSDSDKQLIAYYVSDEELEISGLRSFLGKSLPDYMIPSYFLHMEALPLTSNGKIDKKALPEPDGTINTGVEYASPRNIIESKLVEIWQEILGLEKIGIHDNFFDLGGHSLKATKVVSRISKDLEVTISLRDIFSKPTIRTLSEIISQSNKIKYMHIEVVRDQNSYDISNAQRRLWVLDQLEKESLAYNMPAAFILEGELKADAFRQAYFFMEERHESLRTVIVIENGEPRQKIQKEPECNLEMIDLRESKDSEEEARILAEKDLLIPFNLETGLLFRLTIVRIEDEKNLLLFNMHHIISDGWSMNIFIREFLTCYKSFRECEIPDLKPLRIQYKDYSAWQNDLLESEQINLQKSYWLDKLSGEIPVLDLPSDKVRPASQTFNGNTISFSFAEEINNTLNKLCKENKVSLFMMLQALVKVLIYRYTDQDDIILGSPIAGRVHEDLENQIGLYINILVFRDRISGDSSFIDILQRVKVTCTDAFDNQDYPFDRLVEELDVKRDLSRSPLFDVMLVLHNNEMTDINLEGIDLSPYNNENVVSKFDITFNFSEGDDALYCGVEYNTDIYSEDRIWRMADHFKTLISSVIENPDKMVKKLEIIPEKEKNLLLTEFNDTRSDYPYDKTIIQLFEEQVENTPYNISVVFENIELTYRELNEKANIVGYYLRNNHNIKPNDLVGVLLDRSEKILIALLGILKAGAAYIPLDPDFPKKRIQYMLEDSKPSLVLCEENKGIFLNINTIIESGVSKNNPENISSSNDTAYVIYTSGSTGKPKGIVLSNRSVVNFICAMRGKIDFNPTKAIISVTTFSFDIFVTESLLPLTVGQKIVLASNEQQTDPYALMNLIKKNSINMIQSTPSRIKMLISEESLLNGLSGLTEIMVGGEAFPEDLLKKLNMHFKGKIYNMYGPTETTVWSTIALLGEDAKINIGRPIANTTINILDKNKQIVPVGINGELNISGDGLSSGYLNRMDLTNVKFVNNPIISDTKMYMTGDLACWDSEGNIEYKGRIDNQVKIRGYRIELGEIENNLLQFNGINSTVVNVKISNDGLKILVAYYLSEIEIELKDIRSFLNGLLPEYMIPTHFTHMDSFPLTPNGKIDRKALPEPGDSINKGVEYIAPRDNVEEKLVEIWQEVLGIVKIGIYANFFALGGHSLKATRVVSRISKEFAIDISLKDVFSYPTIAAVSELIKRSSRKEYRQIEVIPEQLSYPVSNAQRRLWLLVQLEEDVVVYNMPSVFTLEGELNTDAFNQAFSFMIVRHESLRTVFVTENGYPRQKILKNPDYKIDIIDLRASSDPERDAQILVEKDLLAPFNLETGPLVRFSVVKIENEKNLLLFNMHHIISDGWSMNIFIREFLNCYSSLEEGNTPDLKPLRIHYKDYSAWQNDLLENSGNNRQREYWLKKLSGELPVLDLPSDNLRPAIQTFNGKSLDFSLSKEIIAELNILCLDNQVSLFMMLQALVKVLFYRYTGQSDIILGSPIAGRVHEDLEDQIGFYVNTLVFRDTIKGETSFKDVLYEVGKSCTEAFDNQTYPFDQLVEDLDLKRDLSRSPLFDVMLVLQNNEIATVEFEGLELSSYSLENMVSKFDMTFNFSENDERLFCGIEYNTDIYSDDRLLRMCEHFKTLVSSVLSNPESRIKDLEIIGEEERDLLLYGFNDTKTDYPSDKTIVDLFEEQVERTPDNIAIVFNDLEITYWELNKKANIVGHYLRNEYDIKPDDLIGVMIERSEKMIIALLGILKAGAAYVPIDPEYPEERIQYILKDSNSRVVVSEHNEGFFIDIKEIIESNKSSHNPVKITTPDNIVYAIYTSGSTGKPKGTFLAHSTVVNFIEGITEKIDFRVDKSILSVTTVSFDIFVTESFLPLSIGQKIVLANKEQQIDPFALREIIIKNKVDMIQTTPSRIKMLTTEVPLLKALSNLSEIMIGGEVFPKDLLEVLTKHCNGRIYNMYGPTETTVWSTLALLNGEKSITIGKPIANIQIYVFDQNQKLLPVGVTGELYISGVCLAQGYLNRPELTAEKFVENPLKSGDRMYRTGDLARWLPDGNIEFLGRIDNQVKIKGFRIELGEIENSLLQYDGISSVVVLSKEESGGDKELVGYYLSENDILVSEIRKFLKKSLPYYMVPSYFIHMEAFPLTPNGKIDRKMLPELDGTFNTGVEYIAPRNRIEEMLASIWQEILSVEIIGIQDNFFELGGHSLKATRVVSRISKDMEVEISLKDIFTNPTIESLSKVVCQSVRTGYHQIEVIGVLDSYELSNAQRRLWILDQLEEDCVAYNMPGAFYLDGEFNKNTFKNAYTFIVKRHESLRTVIIVENGEPRQEIQENPSLNFEIIDLGEAVDKNERIRELVEEDSLTSFNLREDSLIRFTIIKVENEKHLLLFNMHHIISDGWSMNIFIREFLSAYNSFNKGETPEFEPLRIHYKDYSIWQNELLESRSMERQKEYWLEVLSGEMPVLDLPTDFVRPAVKTFSGNHKKLLISKGVTLQLNNLCMESGVSLFMMLHALVKILLHRYTGQEDIILGSPIAGRNHGDLENQIGFYVNTLALRDTILSDIRFNDFLERVHLTCIEAFGNQDYPFDRLVDELDIKRDLSRSPLFDVMLVLLNNDTSDITFDSLVVSPYEIENLTSKFDMTFTFSEGQEELFCNITYNTDIYSENRVERMMKHFMTLIDSVLENSEAQIKELMIIPKEERNLLLNTFNDTKTDYPADKTIIDLFEEQVHNTPDNIAVVFEDIELTYRELNEKANIIAHYLLVNYDIRPDDLVAVILDRSEKMIIALLGILKSGAGYVPIDPEYPEDRINFMIKDSSPKVVFSDRNGDILVDINEILEKCSSSENPENRINPVDLAYIIYTSGSTGHPKGTLVQHLGLFNYLSWIKSNYGRDTGSWCHLTSYAFDLCITGFYTPLITGNSLVIYKSSLDVSELLSRCFSDLTVDSVKLTPSHISILENLNIVSTHIKYIFVGGEELSLKNIGTLHKLNPEIEIINHYGPTESTVGCITNRVDIESESIAIGKPISNTQIYILDKNMKLLPLGVPGELCISGFGMARGYLNLPEITLENFIQHPIIPGERMYRTGDLARWLPDGNIDFLGRIDNQVKIRGFRIELGEIENILVKHEFIGSAVVLVKKGIDGEKKLVAYMVSANEIELSELRNFLKKFLPDYMIPSYFLYMELFPLTLNGKIDRKAFPEPDGTMNTGDEYVVPRNELEEKLVQIWQEILGVERIGIHDNFFELGGHSLKAMRMVSRISRDFNVGVSLKEIFKYPSIQTLSEVLNRCCKTEHKRIEVIPEQDFYIISNSQKRLWLLNQFDKDSIAYNMPSAFTLIGKLNTDAFNQAFSFMIDRHESLRTVFVTENGDPRQKILKNPDFRIEIIDLRASSDPERDAQILAEKDLLTPFNLETGALVRLSVIRIEDEKNLLLFNMHHIISDGWSMNIFIREYLDCYNNFKEGNTPDLKPLRIHYKDYSVWQNDILGSSVIETQRNYWLEKLSGELPILDLPTDSLRPVSQTFNGKSLDLSLSTETNSDLNNLCLDNQVSLFMMLQALVKVLFYRYTGQSDIILGSPFAGRVHEDLEDQIGFYVNTLVFRDNITGESSFKDILYEVGKTCKEAFNNQDYPFDKLVEELEINRDLSRSPLFDVMVVLQNNDRTIVEFEGLELSPYNTVNMVSKFDLTFNFAENKEGLFFSIEYNTDIYKEDRVARMGEHFKTLISSVISNPRSQIKDLQIIPVEEKNLLLNVFNDTKTEYPANKTIIDLFEEQVCKNPDNIALVFEDVELTYWEVNEKANIVGHYLRDNHGIKADDLVGIMLDRSEQMIITLLGILKAGAAYVPIDPEYPQERIDFILEDSSPKVVLSDKNDDYFIDINEILETSLNYDNLDIITTSDNLAYVIYTSGSTGKPKGTLIEQKSVIRLIRDTNYISIDFNDRIFQTGSLSFDASIFEIWGSLLNGASLYLSKDILDIKKFAQDLCRYQITILWLSARLFDQIVSMDISLFKPLNKLLIGGDKLSIQHVNEVRELYPDLSIINGYGPTENTTFTCCFNIEKLYSSDFPIGKPISNTQVYILDSQNNSVPLGVAGELCISGSGLARGYLNRSDLTSEKFVNNPLKFGERMYRTGDLARWLSDGNVEFIGRIDNQVKIRGFRIELGEIENTLVQYDGISSVVVLVKGGTVGDKQLVAYYSSDKELELSELRSYLGGILPDYMIPSYFVHINSFPLTPNGKIDRKALPESDGCFNTGVDYVSPRNKIEEKLVEIWQEVLGIDRIGVHDNFFELGGHSLKATKVVSRISKELEVSLSLKDIFSCPTLEAISEIISSSPKEEYNQIEVVPEQDSYPVSNAQRRLWVLDQFEENSTAYNMPGVYILEGEFQKESFQKAYSFILERHESLRTVFVSENGEPRQKILDNPDFRIETIDLRNYSDKEIKAKELVEQDLLSPFNLQNGPLVRFTVLRLDEEKNLLLFNMHHIISDGWSRNIFTSEFLGLYNNFRNGLFPALAPLRIQYRDYSVWQNNLLESTVMNNQKRYWLDKLGGELPVLNLPADKIRPSVQTYNGNTFVFSLSKQINLRINNLCGENKVSLFMMLQALLKVLLNRYTGQDDFIIGSPVAGRVHKDLEDQIGFYVNTLVFRDTLEGDSVFSEILKDVRKTCTGAFDNQDYPFDRLVEDLDIKRDLSRSPLFDVMLTLHNNENDAVEFEGLQVTPYKTENRISKFDISFDVAETEEGLYIFIEYNTDIYSEDRILRMSEHFKKLVNSVLDNPESRIKDLDILPQEEKNRLLNDFNDTAKDFPEDKTIVQIFQEQVEKTPDNIAVVYEDTVLTYREVNDRANMVAHYLIDNYSIKPDDFVGIVMDRSEKLLISILGVFKSGGAYIPVDPAYPVERKLYILEDSDLKVVIGDKKSLDIIDDNMRNFFIDIDDILEKDLYRENPVIRAKPENLAYVIYTSGSTGKPKGAMVEHIGMMNHISAKLDLLNVTSESRIVQNATQCFDISVWQMLTALFKGGTTYIYSNDLILDPEEMIGKVVEHRITILEVVPTFLSMLIESLSRDIVLKDLDYCLVTGEEIKKTLVKQWFDYFPGKKLVNAYGPTEASDDITHYVMDDVPLNNIVPIGKTVQNFNIYIVDRNFRLCPIGVNGEIVVSGIGVGRGYVNNRERTELAFFTDPFIKDENVRLYKTGDLGRWLPDGNIEFLGRIDNQVKIRGFRIELGEIENALLQFNDINTAVVLAKEGANGEKHLVAYYGSERELEISELRIFLGKSLPDYMIPSFFIHMDELPLTLNGKIDRNALPEPEGNISSGMEYVAPQNETEEKLVGIWGDVLGIERIGVNDNFFDLGGNSLVAIKLISRIMKLFKYKLELKDFIRNSTINKQADLIISSVFIENTILVPFREIGQKLPIFLIPGQSGDAIYYSSLSECMGMEQPVYGLQPIGLDGKTEPLDSIEEIAEKYINAIKSIQAKGPYHIGGHCFGGHIAFEIVYQLEQVGDCVERMLLFDSFAPQVGSNYEFDDQKELNSLIKFVSELHSVEINCDIDLIMKMEENERFFYMSKLFEKNDIYYSEDVIRGKWNVHKSNSLIKYNLQNKYIKGNVLLFKAAERDKSRDSDNYGWSNHVISDIDTYEISGNHTTILDPPNVNEITDILEKESIKI